MIESSFIYPLTKKDSLIDSAFPSPLLLTGGMSCVCHKSILLTKALLHKVMQKYEFKYVCVEEQLSHA